MCQPRSESHYDPNDSMLLGTVPNHLLRHGVMEGVSHGSQGSERKTRDYGEGEGGESMLVESPTQT